MLMDLFYGSSRVAKKQRVHFNAFMLDVHDRKWMGGWGKERRRGSRVWMGGSKESRKEE